MSSKWRLPNRRFPPHHSTTAIYILWTRSTKQKIHTTKKKYGSRETTGAVIECMRKIRLGDLNIYSPKRAADWRVSVNLEVPGS
jgi:hypothetical protein